MNTKIEISATKNHTSSQFSFHLFATFTSTTFICIITILLFFSAETAYADSPPNITIDIPWTDTGGVFDLSTQTFNATFNGVVDTMAAFNHARRQEEIQLGLTSGTLGTLDLPPQATWDQFTDDDKALFILNEERIDRAGMLPNVMGLPLENIELNIDNIAQNYAQVLVDNNDFSHTSDGRQPWQRIDDDPVLGPCHEFLTRSENLAAFWGSTQTSLYIERSYYNWIYADAGSAWGHREAAFLQDIPLNSTDPAHGFKNNVGDPASEGYMGIGVLNDANYNPFGINASGIGTIVVMNIFDPSPSSSCLWPPVLTSTPTAIPSATPSTDTPTLTPTATNTVTSTPTNIPTATTTNTATNTATRHYSQQPYRLGHLLRFHHRHSSYLLQIHWYQQLRQRIQ